MRQEFDQLASSYDAARAVGADGLANWRAAVWVSTACKRPPMLDLGCGTGLFARLLVEWFDVEIIDVEPHRIATSRQCEGHR